MSEDFNSLSRANSDAREIIRFLRNSVFSNVLDSSGGPVKAGSDAVVALLHTVTWDGGYIGKLRKTWTPEAHLRFAAARTSPFEMGGEFSWYSPSAHAAVHAILDRWYQRAESLGLHDFFLSEMLPRMGGDPLDQVRVDWGLLVVVMEAFFGVTDLEQGFRDLADEVWPGFVAWLPTSEFHERFDLIDYPATVAELRNDLSYQIERMDAELEIEFARAAVPLLERRPTPRGRAVTAKASSRDGGRAISIDKKSLSVTINGHRLKSLSASDDFKVFCALAATPDSIVSHLALARAVRGDAISEAVNGASRAYPEVLEAIKHIRAALRKVPGELRVENVKKHGYILRSAK